LSKVNVSIASGGYVEQILASRARLGAGKSANPNGQTTFEYEKKTYLGSFNRIMFADIGVISMVDEKAAFSDVERIRQRNLYIAVIVLSIAILIVFSLQKPLRLRFKDSWELQARLKTEIS